MQTCHTGTVRRRYLDSWFALGALVISVTGAAVLSLATAPTGFASLQPATAPMGRLRSAESFCRGDVRLNPPTPAEHPRVGVPGFVAVSFPTRVGQPVGPPPTPAIVYARVTENDFGVASGSGFRRYLDGAPAWVVVFRSVTIIPTGGAVVIGAEGKTQVEPRTVAHETVIAVIDPASGSTLDIRACPSAG